MKFNLVLTLVALSFCGRLLSQNIVHDNGRLTVAGNKIVNKNGKPVSFAGNSFFWGNDNWQGEKFYNANVVNWLVSDWKSSIVRVAMGVDETGGYISSPESNKAKVKVLVDAAIAANIYVIIDWHSHHAELYTEQAKVFFSEMAKLYGSYDNVMFELYNEPKQIPWSTVKSYAEAVIPVIRQYSQNLILVGSPTWSQDVNLAADQPIVMTSNLAYTIHFYAGTHKQALRDKCDYALNKGIALFATEWGTCDASGEGNFDMAESRRWIDYLDRNEISHCNWSICDKVETASVLLPGANVNGGWTELAPSGQFVRDIIRAHKID